LHRREPLKYAALPGEDGFPVLAGGGNGGTIITSPLSAMMGAGAMPSNGVTREDGVCA
jgi:hypothetical protein